MPEVVGAVASGMARVGAGLGAFFRTMSGPRPRPRPIHGRPVTPEPAAVPPGGPSSQPPVVAKTVAVEEQTPEAVAPADSARDAPGAVSDGPAGAREAERRWTFLDVAGRLAHEVRNPLTAVEMSVFVLGDAIRGLHRPDLESVVDELGDAGRRISMSVDELLEFSRVAAGTMELERETIRPVDVADDALRDARLYRPGGLAYREAVDRLDLATNADRMRLRLVLRSLVRYLLDYGQPPVRVLVAGQGRGVVFRVEDSGPGLSAEERRAALERLHAGPDVGAAFGAGLGLFLCLPLVEAHGGTLEAEELAGGGTAFVIRIPGDEPR